MDKAESDIIVCMKLIILVTILLIVSCIVLFGDKKGAEIGESFGINGKCEAGCTGCLALGVLLVFAVYALLSVLFHIR